MCKKPHVNPICNGKRRIVWLEWKLVKNVRRNRMREDKRIWVNQEIGTKRHLASLVSGSKSENLPSSPQYQSPHCAPFPDRPLSKCYKDSLWSFMSGFGCHEKHEEGLWGQSAAKNNCPFDLLSSS